MKKRYKYKNFEYEYFKQGLYWLTFPNGLRGKIHSATETELLEKINQLSKGLEE